MATSGKSSKSPKSGRRQVRAGANAPRSEKVQISLLKIMFSRLFLVVLAAVAAGLLLVIGIFLWFTKVYGDPENVFWGMVDNNLATRGVTKEVQQQNQAGASRELTQLSWNPEPRVRNVQQLTYATQAGPPVKLTLETLITPTDQYQHYTNIDRPDAQGKTYGDIYKLWLLNGGSGAADNPNAFSNVAYGALLFGNMERPDRERIEDLLKKAYKLDMSKLEKTESNGRRAYAYSVTLNLREYANAAREYSRILGLPGADFINPQGYKTTDQVIVKMVVDILSRHLVRVEYQGSLEETYSGWGIPAQIKLPAKTVPADQLQKAIEAATK